METHTDRRQDTLSNSDLSCSGSHTTRFTAALIRTTVALMTLAWFGPSAIEALPPGETVGHQTICWTMTPYEDELRMEVALVEPRAVGFYTLGTQWYGGWTYFFEGAGDGLINFSRTRIAFSFLFYNHTQWGNGPGQGRFSASIATSTLNGPWSLAKVSEGIHPTSPYGAVGYLVRKPCSQMGSVPPGDPPNLVLAPSD